MGLPGCKHIVSRVSPLLVDHFLVYLSLAGSLGMPTQECSNHGHCLVVKNCLHNTCILSKALSACGQPLPRQWSVSRGLG